MKRICTAQSCFTKKASKLARRLGRKGLIATYLNQLGRVTQLEGDYRLARRFHEEALSLDQDDQSAAAMTFIARVDIIEGKFEHALDLLRDALNIATQREARPEIAAINFQMGICAESRGKLREARATFEANLDSWRELGSSRGVSACLEHLGSIACRRKEFEAAHNLLQESLSIRRELRHRLGVASSLQGLGDVYRNKKEWERAGARYREALRIRADVDHRLGIAQSIERLARCAFRRGDSSTACKLFGTSAALRDMLNAVVAPIDLPALEHELASLTSGLGPAAFERTWQEGREIPLEEAIALASRT